MLYMAMGPAPPLDYLDSLELFLVHNGDVDDENVRAIFAQKRPLMFWGCPRLLVSKIVEAFAELEKEPTCVDVTITVLSSGRGDFALFGPLTASEAWPQAYITHLPCHVCATVQTVERRSLLRVRDSDPDPAGNVDVVVDTFHVSSRAFGKRLTVGLHYRLLPGTLQTEREQSYFVHKITVGLADETCSGKEGPATAKRSRPTLMLVPDVASGVYSFLERAQLGSSLLANGQLHDTISQLQQQKLLPVHHLTCRFGADPKARGLHTGAYCVEIRHFQTDLPYTDVRHFVVPSAAGADNDCATIRHYLGNSYVAELFPPVHDFRLAIKMLASLAACNFAVGGLQLDAKDQRLSDYRSMDAIFGGMQINELNLSCDERRFVELVKITDFLRMSTVRRLRKLKLNLSQKWAKRQKPSSLSRSKNPLWVSGIHLLRNCEYYRVDGDWPECHLRLIERKMAQICEDFERGKVAGTVDHFHFKTYLPNGMTLAFNRDNLVASGIQAEGTTNWFQNVSFRWDVYHFRNPSTEDCLTACIGRKLMSGFCIVHILKGEVYPDSSFAD